jgi:transposase
VADLRGDVDDPDFESTIVGAHQHEPGRKQRGLKIKHSEHQDTWPFEAWDVPCGSHYRRSEGRYTASRRIDRRSPAEVVMADTVYDADQLRQAIAAKGAIVVIPTTRHAHLTTRSTSISMPSAISSNAASQLKQFRGVATRFEMTVRITVGGHSRRNHPVDAISINTTWGIDQARNQQTRFRCMQMIHTIRSRHSTLSGVSRLHSSPKSITFAMSRGDRPSIVPRHSDYDFFGGDGIVAAYFGAGFFDCEHPFDAGGVSLLLPSGDFADEALGVVDSGSRH